MANYESTTISYNSSGEISEPADMTFEQMYAAYYDRLIKFMQQQYPNLPEAEHAEVVQDAMIKAMTHYDEYREIGYSRSTWLYQIVKRTALDRLRFNSRRNSLPASDMLAYENHADLSADVDFDNIYSNDNVKIALAHVANVLTEQEIQNGWFDIFKLYAIEDKNDREISELLDINKTTVRTRIFKLRKRLADNAVLHDMLSGQSITG